MKGSDEADIFWYVVCFSQAEVDGPRFRSGMTMT